MYRYNMAFAFAFTLWDMGAAQNDCIPKDCYDLKCYRMSKAPDGGGWIMYQRRVDGTVHFTRNWEEYQHMFGWHGDSSTELWLGNENVYQMLQSYGVGTAN